MKKWFALCLAVLVLCALVGCGEKAKTDDKGKDTPTTTTTNQQEVAPISLLEGKIPSDCYWYEDADAIGRNMAVMVQANVDLTELSWLALNPDPPIVERVLYTRTLNKDEVWTVNTYINDAVPNRGIACTDKDGKTYYYAITYSMKGDGSPSLSLKELDIEPLSEEKLEEIEAYLNKTENNGFVSTLNLYNAPQEASLYAIFYDGAGVGEWGSSHWDATEQAAVLAACDWDEFYVPVLKIKAADVEQVLQAKLGVSYAQMEKTMEECGFHYVKEYDAYYDMHSDTNYLAVEVSAVTLNPEGLYVVEYTQPQYDEDDRLAVTLRPTTDGYQFVSNVKIEE